MLEFAVSPIPLFLVRDNKFGRPLHRDPELVRVQHGVYVERAAWAELPPWNRYLVRVHAVRLTRPDSVFILESAAALHGLPLFGEPTHVHTLGRWAPGTHSTSSGGVAVHQLSGDRSVVATAEGAAVSIADTLLDLGRLLPPAFGLAVADAALRRAATDVTTSALLERARRQQWSRGMRRLEWVLGNADAASESVGESISRAVIDWLGYPAPLLQKWFHTPGFDDRTDFYWPGYDVIGESDGYGKYDADDTEAAKRHFIDEKRREDRLRRQVKGFVRWDYADAMHPSNLDHKLRAGGLLPVTPANHRMLATLAHNPRSFE